MAINKTEHKEVKQNYLSDIGMINETDVSLAKASNALLIGFNVKSNREAKIIEDQKIDIKFLILQCDWLCWKIITGLLEPDIKEQIGSAEIQKFLKFLMRR